LRTHDSLGQQLQLVGDPHDRLVPQHATDAVVEDVDGGVLVDGTAGKYMTRVYMSVILHMTGTPGFAKFDPKASQILDHHPLCVACSKKSLGQLQPFRCSDCSPFRQLPLLKQDFYYLPIPTTMPAAPMLTVHCNDHTNTSTSTPEWAVQQHQLSAALLLKQHYAQTCNPTTMPSTPRTPEWVVQQDQLRVVVGSTCQAHTLALAA
jgi:hypothetical protein